MRFFYDYTHGANNADYLYAAPGQELKWTPVNNPRRSRQALEIYVWFLVPERHVEKAEVLNTWFDAYFTEISEEEARAIDNTFIERVYEMERRSA